MLRKFFPYRPDLKEKERHNRNHPTFSEKILWFGLRGKQLGVDFDRQKPIGNFILDFYCKELNLGIELDAIHMRVRNPMMSGGKLNWKIWE